MAIRDLLVTLLVFGSIPFIFWRPHIGILVWSWLSYMNPHRLGWGFAYSMPFAQIIAAVLFLAMIFSREKIRVSWSGTIFIWLLFLAWMVVTTILAIYPDRAMLLLDKVLKIQLITLVTLMLINDRERLRALIWVIVVSIGFFCVKGGFFTLITGGGFRVYGPPDSYITENNALALATLMIIPLMFYLYQVHKQNTWIRLGLGLAMFFSVISAVGSQSRGALIAIAALGGFFWLKSNKKFLSGTILVVLAVLVFSFMPESWHERMASIQNYQQDASAMGRIHAWKYAINVANDRLTGGGFNSWSDSTYAMYSPQSEAKVVAHSIYFAVLADHGWPGLVMFLTILFLIWRKLSALTKMKRSDIDRFQPILLAKMLQVSLIAYLSGGAFLSLSYFDLPWHVIAISLILAHLYSKESESTVHSEKRIASKR